MDTTTHISIGDARSIEVTPEVLQAINSCQPVAVGVSGGKDSAAVAFAADIALDRLGHTGPRLLIHSDLGLIEWADSLPACRRLATRLGWELVVVRRKRGDMIDRWRQRWNDNWNRYSRLQTLTLLLPWSTPKWRFCTSELKVGPISLYLSRRFTRSTILSATGIRREEGRAGLSEGGRANAQTSKPEPKLRCKGRDTTGYQWNPIAHWSEDDVWRFLAANNFEPHEAYTRFDARRVSCVFCIFSSEADLFIALEDSRNHEAYRAMCALELETAFSFQPGRWLSDLRPDLLDAPHLPTPAEAKVIAAHRAKLDAQIPAHLRFKRKYPPHIPTIAEATSLANARQAISSLYARPIQFTDPQKILSRYQSLHQRGAATGKLIPTDKTQCVQTALL